MPWNSQNLEAKSNSAEESLPKEKMVLLCSLLKFTFRTLAMESVSLTKENFLSYLESSLKRAVLTKQELASVSISASRSASSLEAPSALTPNSAKALNSSSNSCSMSPRSLRSHSSLETFNLVPQRKLILNSAKKKSILVIRLRSCRTLRTRIALWWLLTLSKSSITHRNPVLA